MLVAETSGSFNLFANLCDTILQLCFVPATALTACCTGRCRAEIRPCSALASPPAPRAAPGAAPRHWQIAIESESGSNSSAETLAPRLGREVAQPQAAGFG